VDLARITTGAIAGSVAVDLGILFVAGMLAHGGLVRPATPRTAARPADSPPLTSA
jgi:hypothetical protein